MVAREDDAPGTSGRELLVSLGELPRSTSDRAAQVSFSPNGRLLACLGSGKATEIFRFCRSGFRSFHALSIQQATSLRPHVSAMATKMRAFVRMCKMTVSICNDVHPLPKILSILQDMRCCTLQNCPAATMQAVNWIKMPILPQHLCIIASTSCVWRQACSPSYSLMAPPAMQQVVASKPMLSCSQAQR